MVNQNKRKLISLLLGLFIIAGSVLGFIQFFQTSATQHAHASTGWQLQALWHTPVATPSQLGLIGSNCDGLGGVSDLTYASGTIFETFLYHGTCTAQPPNETNGFDATTGAPVWNQNPLVGGSGSVWQAPLVSNGTLVVPNAYAWTGSAWLEGFDATNAQTPELWTAGGTDAAVANGAVYAQNWGPINSGPAGSIASYDLASGTVKWQNANNVCGGSPKIEIANGVVYYIGCGSADGTYSIQARSVTDGSLLWSQAINAPTITFGLAGLSPSFNSTLISTGSIFVTSATTDGSGNPTLSSYSSTDGTNKWSKTLSDTPSTTCTSTSCSFIGQIIASGSVVYVLEDNAYNHDTHYLPSADVYALDAASGNELWHKSITVNGYLYNGQYAGNTAFHGTLVNGVLYFNFSNAIYALGAATGNQLMMDDTVAAGSGKNPISTPLVVGDVMYVTGTDSNSSSQYTIYAYKILSTPTPTPTPSPTVTPTPSPSPSPTVTPTPTPQTVNLSFNYAGYIVSDTKSAYTTIKGDWTIPTIQHCPKSTNVTTASWVGLGGPKGTDSHIQQTGTASECINGKANYYAWVEMFGSKDGAIHNLRDYNFTYTIEPGDSMHGEVILQGGDSYILKLSDKTKKRKWDFTSPILHSGDSSSSSHEDALWIFEDQGGNTAIPSFSDFSFTSCVANEKAIDKQPMVVRETIGTFDRQYSFPVVPIRVYVTPLQNNGKNFTVQFKG